MTFNAEELAAAICNAKGECHGDHQANSATEAILIAAIELQRIADILEALSELAHSINWQPQ